MQKVLAHAGIGSRRACEDLILQGRVTVDGQVVRELGSKVDPGRQKVALDGQAIRIERPVYFAVHKPRGYVSTNHDPAGRPRVVDLLPEVPERVYAVGRLDEMSMGLILLTNDGELANKLAHPKFGVEKVYRAVVAGFPTREVIDQLIQGVWLAEGKARARRVRIVGRQGEATILEMVLAEGKNREVRRMFAKLGHKVMSLVRVAVGPISVKGLKPGECRHLTGREVDLLRRVADGQPVPTAMFSNDRPRDYRPARRGPGRVQGGPPTTARPPLPASGPPPAAGRPQRPPTGGPAARPRPPRPPSGPASRRAGAPPRPPTGPAARRAAVPPRPPMPPRPEPPTRKIIGLPPEPPAGPRGRRPPPRRHLPTPPPPRRGSPGPKRRRPGVEDAGEGES